MSSRSQIKIAKSIAAPKSQFSLKKPSLGVDFLMNRRRPAVARRSRFNFAMNAHSGAVEPSLSEHPDFEVSDKLSEPEVKPSYFDEFFNKVEIVRDPQLGDSALGSMIASALPLAITNILLMSLWQMEPQFGSDGDCNCGLCEVCSMKVQLLDH